MNVTERPPSGENDKAALVAQPVASGLRAVTPHSLIEFGHVFPDLIRLDFYPCHASLVELSWMDAPLLLSAGAASSQVFRKGLFA